jgi:ribosomal protein S18 acetylase RimI-like enzyme
MIRLATLSDSGAILDCLHTAFAPFREFYSPEGYADTALTSHTLARRFTTMKVFVAEESNRIIGTIACAVHENATGHIRGMAVLPEYQGRGVAEELLQTVEDELRQRGCTRIKLDTTTPLQRAIRFYERNGYRASGKVGDHFGMPLHEYVKEL